MRAGDGATEFISDQEEHDEGQNNGSLISPLSCDYILTSLARRSGWVSARFLVSEMSFERS